MRLMLKPPPVPGTTTIAGLDDEFDEFIKQAGELVCQYKRATALLLQRRLLVGYGRAARIMDLLQEAGVVGPQDGTYPREVLIKNPEEVLGKLDETSDPQALTADDPFYFPEKYKSLPDVDLSQVENPSWEPQLAEILESNEFENSKSRYPVVLGRAEKDALHIESLLLSAHASFPKSLYYPLG